MNRQTIRPQTILPRLFLLGLAIAVNAIVSQSALSAEDISHYGLAAEGNGLAQIYETNFVQVAANQKEQPEAPALQLKVDYLDKTADLFSPHHSFNTELEPKLHNRSHEIETQMGYRFDYLIPKAAFKYSPDSYGMGKYYNYELGISVPVKDIFSLETRYGWNKFDKKPQEGGMKNYQDWSIGVSTTYKGVKLKVDYIDVNANEDSEECQQSFPCEGKTVFSIIKNF